MLKDALISLARWISMCKSFMIPSSILLSPENPDRSDAKCRRICLAMDAQPNNHEVLRSNSPL